VATGRHRLWRLQPYEPRGVRCRSHSLPSFFLVAEHERQLVGYIHASVQRDNPVEVIPADQPYVAIEDLYVHRDFRDRDIGGALLESIFAIARQAGIERFIVGTLSKETDSILRFYRRHGFTAWHIQFFK
jgi:GNAT superfamily N-acetyltransferase